MTTHLARLRSSVGPLACVAVLGAAGAAAAAPGPGLMPDLVADPPVGPVTSVEPVHGRPGHRLLLRFDGHVHNIGPGRLEIVGQRPAGSYGDDTLRMTDVRQRIYDASGALVDELPSPAVVPHAGPHASDRHRHWHTDRATAYWLVEGEGLADVVESDKVGFCLADSTPIEAPDDEPPRYWASHCRGLDAAGRSLDYAQSMDAATVVMGISPGFRDLYAARYFTQWVDLTGRVAPGRYRLKAVADPTGAIAEADEDNAPAYSTPFALRGWLAQPVAAAPAPSGAPQRIALTARAVVGAGLPAGDPYLGEPDPAMFVLATPPAHGTVTISGDVATYTPAPGHAGPDRFAVAALEEESALAAPPATVDVGVLPGPAAAAPPAPPAPPVARPQGRPGPAGRPGGARFRLSAAQLLINQRIGQAAIRRLAAVAAALHGAADRGPAADQPAHRPGGGAAGERPGGAGRRLTARGLRYGGRSSAGEAGDVCPSCARSTSSSPS
ncbi:lysyl oxidase family protein [Miltoncostaea marina]|uniref:lysyl oxidase family protein n=1 Tax=Miltoncostaea marina TaxID=2843215 RepID=UPI001C3C2FDD|nr:lysyl oxidase family protein [Miltoncostaea marina]